MIREINLCKKNDRLFEKTATFLTPKITPIVLSFDQLNILANNCIPDPCNGCLEAYKEGSSLTCDHKSVGRSAKTITDCEKRIKFMDFLDDLVDVGLYDLYKDIYELQELGIQMEKAKNMLLRSRSDWQKKLNEVDAKYKGPGDTSIFLCGINAKNH